MSSKTAFMPASVTDPAVVDFTTAFKLIDPPVILTYQNYGYGSDWCHVSAKAHAINNGGKRVHGWALWQFCNGLMGDFHSVWEDTTGKLIDVTPPKFGKNQVMFILDRQADIYQLEDVFVQPNNRMAPPNPQFWFDGQPTNEDVWGFKSTAPTFVAYCAKLGFNVNDYPTAPLFG